MGGLLNHSVFQEDEDYQNKADETTSLVEDVIEALEGYIDITKTSMASGGLSEQGLQAIQIGMAFIQKRYHVDRELASLEAIQDGHSLYTASMETLVDLEYLHSTLKNCLNKTTIF